MAKEKQSQRAAAGAVAPSLNAAIPSAAAAAAAAAAANNAVFVAAPQSAVPPAAVANRGGRGGRGGWRGGARGGDALGDGRFAGVSAGSVWSRATLVLVQASTLGQWVREIDGACKEPKLAVLQHYGGNRPRNPADLADYDVVLTTYAIAVMEAGNLLGAINWHRIILDEGHVLKSNATQRSNMLRGLHTRHRWVVTGTPYNKELSDINGLLRFLTLPPAPPMPRLAPHAGPSANHNLSLNSMLYYEAVLRNATMRHSKTQQFSGGRPLMALPARHTHTHSVALQPAERALYDRVYREAKLRFAAIDGAGQLRVKSFYISGMLMALRRACSAGSYNVAETLASAFFSEELLHLVKREVTQKGPAAAAIVAAELEEAVQEAFNDSDQCLVCLDVMNEPLATPCNHVFCSGCINSIAKSKHRPECPMCRQPFKVDQLRRAHIGKPAPDPAVEAEAAAAAAAAAEAEAVAAAAAAAASAVSELDAAEAARGASTGFMVLKSKSATAVDLVRRLCDAEPGVKVVVFTQFSECFSHMQRDLFLAGLQFRFVSGDMPSTRRDKMIQQFVSDPAVTVFLLSTRTGAVGLTLTAANHVVMMEPCMNRAHEEQAVNRVYRIGQTRDVHIHYLVAKNTVEETIMAINSERRSSDGAAAGGAAGAGAGATATESDYRRLFAAAPKAN